MRLTLAALLASSWSAPAAGAQAAWVDADLDGFLCLQAADRSLTCPGATFGPPPGPFVQFAVGSDHACGVRPDGTLACWGATDQVRPPAGRFVQVDVASREACAVSAEGEIRCWALPEAPLPAGVAWWGRRDAPAVVSPPAGPHRLVRIVDGAGCALRRDGEVACWGFRGLVASPPGPFVDLSLGDGVCALRQEGLIQCWGGRARAQPGLYAGLEGSCGLTAEGALVCADEGGPRLPFLESLRFRTVRGERVGAYGGFAGILRDGRLVLAGRFPPGLLVPVVDVSVQWLGQWCGARADGGMACGGQGGGLVTYGPEPFLSVRGSCGRTAAGRVHCPRQPIVHEGHREPPKGEWKQLPAGPQGCGVTKAGAVSCDPEPGVCRPPGVADRNPRWPAPACAGPPPDGRDFVRAASGIGHACALRADGRLDCWGALATHRRDVTWPAEPMTAPPGRYRDVAVGSSHVCAARADGPLVCWGRPSEALAAPSGHFRALDAHESTTCGVRDDGVVVCWGDGL